MRSLDAPAHQPARGRSSCRAAVWALVATLAAPGAASAATGDTALRFARDVAAAGPRPATGAGEARAQRLAGRALPAAGMRVSTQAFRVPGKGRSRNVIGVRPGPRALPARGHGPRRHGGRVARARNDNASGLGALAELAAPHPPGRPAV